MHFGRAPKIVAITLVGLTVVSLGLAQFFTKHVEALLKAELAQRLPGVTQQLGITLKYDALSFSLLKGLALQGVSIARPDRPLISVESIEFLYAFHLKPTLHVRIDGARLLRPELRWVFHDEESNTTLQRLMEIFRSGELAVADTATQFLGESYDTDLPVELSPQLKLLWQQGQLTLVGERSPLTGEPVAITLQKIAGSLSYNQQDAKLLLETAARFADAGGKLTVKATRTDGKFKLELDAQAITLAKLTSVLPEFVVATADTQADLKLKAENTAELWTADFNFAVKAASLDHWRLAAQPISELDLSLAGKLNYDSMAERIDFEPLHIHANGLEFIATGSTAFAEGFQLDSSIKGESVPLQKFLHALPKGLAPALVGAEVAGSIKLGLDFAVDTTNLKALKFAPQIEVDGFKLLKASSAVDIEKLKQPFLHQAKKRGEVIKTFMVGRQNRFVPYSRLGKNTIKGVLTCEDGSFLRHNGFRVDHFRESLIQDIREQRFARGASTITMQTAKNLFLTGQKNLSRKFQEILIAYALEQLLTKQRILEIYMNIIEWGPKIYGIGAASKHYFDKAPQDLNPLEAAFLGSIIPPPVKSHGRYRRGSVTDQWATYLALIVSKMGIYGQEYEALDPFQPEFDWVRKQRLAQEKVKPVKKKRRRLRSRVRRR